MIPHFIEHTTGGAFPPLTVAGELPSPFKRFSRSGNGTLRCAVIASLFHGWYVVNFQACRQTAFCGWYYKTNSWLSFNARLANARPSLSVNSTSNTHGSSHSTTVPTCPQRSFLSGRFSVNTTTSRSLISCLISLCRGFASSFAGCVAEWISFNCRIETWV